MKSKTQINSTKELERASLEMVHRRCKADHFAHPQGLPVKKNISTYASSHGNEELKGLLKKIKIENAQKIVPPPMLESSLLKRSLHESSLHFSPTKVPKLPDLKAVSVYKESFLQQEAQKIVKGKEQDGFFIKMPWHDNPNTNYHKSYQKSDRSVSPVEKGKAVQGALAVHRRPFNAKSIYNECYSPLKKSALQDSKDCIKNRDHLKGKNCSFSGSSEYTQRYKSLHGKQNLTTIKSIPEKRKSKGSLLPVIRQEQKRYGKQKANKKDSISYKLKKKVKTNSIVEQPSSSLSTHQRIFGE